MKRKLSIVALLLAGMMLMTACAIPGIVPTAQENNPTTLEKGNYNADMEQLNNTNSSKAYIWPWEDDSITLPPFTGSVTEAGTIHSLKVLAIGDSSSKDSLQFLAKLAIEAGIEDVKVGMLYRNAGGGLDAQWGDFNNNSAAYTYYEDTGAGWVATPDACAQDTLKADKWDYVIVHQNLCLHPDASTYSTLPQFITAIDGILCGGSGDNTNKNPEAKILWMQTWAYEINSRNNLYNHTKYYKNPQTNAYDQTLMYTTAVETIKNKVLSQQKVAGMIPVGTAVQNMREAYWTDGMTHDGEFLSNTGKVMAALMMFKSLTGYDINGMELSDPVFDHARPHLVVIKESVNNAYLNPYAVTTSVYSTN